MPRKKESGNRPLPGFDIFEQPLPDQDQGILLKPHYRRKQLAGFVPLWNEFFRCYHLAGVSPGAVYLWAYLRQHEHERREWNAISDISWPGRRDIAEALGVSISHLPNLLFELRQAGLLSFQSVLPGFEELAGGLSITTHEALERAAEFGVNPKVDATLYRTSDPLTKTEFARMSGLKYCKSCKALRYCEGAKEARGRLRSNSSLEDFSISAGYPETTRDSGTGPVVKKSAAISQPDPGRQLDIKLIPIAGKNPGKGSPERTEPVEKQEIVKAVFKKERPPNLLENRGRIKLDSEAVTKKERSPNPSRFKTNMNQTTVLIQPEVTTTKNGKQPGKFEPDKKPLVVENGINGKDSKLIEKQGEENRQEELDLLLKFGFDQNTGLKLITRARSFQKPAGYIQGILKYARENARQNPQGMVRRIIEKGEDRLSRVERWQQSALFEPVGFQKDQNLPELSLGGHSREAQEAAEVENFSNNQGPEDSPETEREEFSRDNRKAGQQANLATSFGLAVEEVSWWNQLVKDLADRGYQVVAEAFEAAVALPPTPDSRLKVILPTLFDQYRASAYATQLEHAILVSTGKFLRIELGSPGEY